MIPYNPHGVPIQYFMEVLHQCNPPFSRFILCKVREYYWSIWPHSSKCRLAIRFLDPDIQFISPIIWAVSWLNGNSWIL